MPIVTFAKTGKKLELPYGANLFHTLIEMGVPVASSCGGEGVCTLCIIKIIEGKKNVSEEGELEADMREIYEFDKDYRMSCQTKILGDITIDTDYW